MNDVEKILNTKIKSISKKLYYFVIDTDNGKFIVKNKDNNVIYNYLDNHNSSFYLPLISSTKKYNIYKYYEDIDNEIDSKANDLIKLVAIIHKRTCFYKDIDIVRVKSLYSESLKQLDYLVFFYQKLSDYYEGFIYYLPSMYFYLYNSSTIFYSINLCKKLLKEYIDLSKEISIERNAVINNNISFNNYIKSSEDIIIDWSNSNYNILINDLYLFFFNNPKYINLLMLYESILELTHFERLELFIRLLIPNKINITDKELCNTLLFKNMIYRLNNTIKLYLEYEKKQKEEQTS